MKQQKFLAIVHDEKNRQVVDEILSAMGTKYDFAGCLAEAREAVRRDGYTLVLLDHEIPARPGGTPRAQNTEYVLDELVSAKGKDAAPVIMLADRFPDADDEDKFRWAAEMQSRGVMTFVCRPFRTRGRTLERVIKKVVTGKADVVRMKREPAAEPAAGQEVEKSTPAPITAVSAAQQGQSDESPADAYEVMAERWLSIPNEPIGLDDFMVKFCEQRSRENRKARKRALLAAARHKTVTLPPLAGIRKHGQSNKYFAHDLLAAWEGFKGEGIDLPQVVEQDG